MANTQLPVSNPSPSLYEAFMHVIEKIEQVNADTEGSTGARTYHYLKLNTLLDKIKPKFRDEHLGFYQRVRLIENEQTLRLYNQSPENKGRNKYSNSPQPTVEQPLFLSVVDTFIFNSKGEHLLVGSYPFAMTGNPKANGSALTYARRYSLFAALGIYPDPDDDGTAAQAQYEAVQQNVQPTSPWKTAQQARYQQNTNPQEDYQSAPSQDVPSGGATREQCEQLIAECKSKGLDVISIASQIKGHKVGKLRELTQQDIQLIQMRITQLTGDEYASA